MKKIKREIAVYSVKKNPETGEEVLVPDSSARFIDYTSDDLKKWIEKKVIPDELMDVALGSLDDAIKKASKYKKNKSQKGESPNFIESMKKEVALIEWLLKNKNKLVKLCSELEEEPTFRQPTALIENKLEPLQLTFLNDDGSETITHTNQNQEILIREFRLTSAEDRLVNTLSKLLSNLSDKDQDSDSYYMGNDKKKIIKFDGYETYGANLKITPYQLISAYYDKTNYGQDNAKFVLKTLFELSDKVFQVSIQIQNGNNKEGDPLYDLVRTKMPLVKAVMINPGLTKKEASKLAFKEPHTEEKNSFLLIKLSPLFTHEIKCRYVEFPKDIDSRISKECNVKKIPQCVLLLRDLLFREKQMKRFNVLQRNEKTLIETLGLQSDYNYQKKALCRKKIASAFDVFQRIGLVKWWKVTRGAKNQMRYDFQLNPDFK